MNFKIKNFYTKKLNGMIFDYSRNFYSNHLALQNGIQNSLITYKTILTLKYFKPMLLKKLTLFNSRNATICERKNKGTPTKLAITKQVAIKTTIFKAILLIEVKCAPAIPTKKIVNNNNQNFTFSFAFSPKENYCCRITTSNQNTSQN